MYKIVIGLEVHCELNTISKNFSGSKNEYSEKPNSNVSTVDLGFPGILPLVNEQGINSALKMALAFNCKIPEYFMFDRKHYFYPDLPKGYQITQNKYPIGTDGYVMINVNGEDKKIIISDTHLEEDTASLDHFGNYSLIDYNRSGIPLLETVTTPCINSADEAIAFLETLRSMFLYCGTSEARSDKGQMRCDVNINLKDENDNYVTPKVEMKNINSFNNVRLAIEYEAKRQEEALKNGEKLLQETRRFSDEDNCTYAMRSKVDAVDYKYFVEPNIPPIKITKEKIESVKKTIPELQFERINKYINSYGLSRYDATNLAKEKEVSDYFESCIAEGGDPKVSANWLTTRILGHINKYEMKITDVFITPKMLVELVKMVDKGDISSKQAKEVLYEALTEEKNPLDIIKEKNIKQNTNEDEILEFIEEVLKENPTAKEQYQNGKTNILDYLVGQVMKKSRGQANPAITRDKMKNLLEKR